MYNKENLPENRRKKLKELLKENRIIRILESHDALSALIAENVEVDGRQYDGIWMSSLCDSTIRGKEDIEIVDVTSRLITAREIMEVTKKPIIFDGDTGGFIEHFVYNIRKMEQLGISAVIIEDKTGLKRNSLFGTEVEQYQEDKDEFAKKIKVGKESLATDDFMIIARIESLILGKGVDDALERARTYVAAGADGIMIHSKSKDETDIRVFCECFRKEFNNIPLVVVPTTYNHVKESEFFSWGVNIVIYANQLIRSAYLSMKTVAEEILKNERSLEVDDKCITVKEILNLIKHGE